MAKRNKKKFRNQYAQMAMKPPQPRAEVMPEIDLRFLAASIVTLRDWDFVHFILVGAGGTGAYVAQHVGKIMHSIYYIQNKGAHLTIVDPDIVEERNIGRQLFCNAEVGQPKAEALARRYGQAWGLNATSFVGRFDEGLVIGRDLTILIGCVDNAEARLALAQTLEHNPISNSLDNPPAMWWIDCGNLNETGRVLLGTANSSEQLRGACPEKNVAIALPGPAMQYPDLLTARPEEMDFSGMSCAQLAEANLQSLNINAAIAVEAADMITRLILTKNLRRFACEVNLASGSVRSTYSTPEEIARVAKCQVSHLKDTRPALSGLG